MSRMAAAALLIGLFGVALYLNDEPKPVLPVATYPPADLFEDMDLTDALIVGVVQEPDGSPAARTSVFVDAYFRRLGTEESHPHEPQVTTTDSEGRFVFRSSDALREEARRNRVKVWAERDDLMAPQVILRVVARREIAQVLTLGPSLLPKVRLVDPDGEPVVGAYVTLDFNVPAFDVAELLYTLGARSGADGVALLPRLPDRRDWQVDLHVNPEEMPPYITGIPLHEVRRARPVTVRLLAGCTVQGRMAMPDGSPAGGARVSACAVPNPQGGCATVTDLQGAFVLRGVPTGRAVLTCGVLSRDVPPEVRFRAVAAAVDARMTRIVHGEEGAIVDIGTVRLVGTHSISGVVLGRDGEPAALGHVMAEPVGGKATGHSIKADGRFEVNGLSPGRHTLTATIHEGAYTAFGGLVAKLKNVPVGATDVVIRVTGGGNLIARFHPLGKPNEPLEVWEPWLGSRTQGGTGPGGKYTEVRGVFQQGRYGDFFVVAEGYKEKALGPVEIHADRPTFVDVELEAEE